MEESMSEHYFSSAPTSVSKPRSFDFSVAGMTVRFGSDSGVFSADRVDKGSAFMLETLLSFRKWDGVRTLDIGCGYGTLGITLAKAGADVVMCDVNSRALELCRANAKLNGVKAECLEANAAEGVAGEFDAVVTNPPIRAGKQVVYSFFDNAHALLKQGGELFVVIRKQQGAESAERHISEVFGNCEVLDKEAGYRVLYSVKR